MAVSVRPEILDSLTEGIAALTTSENWRRHLDCQRRFHGYSFGNVVLIHRQAPGATRVAGFNTWLRLGRHVRRGERGIAILAPCIYKSDHEDDDQGEVRRVLRGFKVAHAFDVEQTEGEELPEVCRKLQGDAPADAFDRLAQVAHELGYSVERQELGSTNGDCNFALHRLRVSSEISDLQAVKTLAHELAHAVLHENVVTDRASAELEAESVAYILSAELGLDSSEYTFGYMATWAGGGDQAIVGIKTAGERIQGAVRQILTALEAG
jgi:antirestriction protein ArdC